MTRSDDTVAPGVCASRAPGEATIQGADECPKPLRLLLVEDDPNDALLIVLELDHGGFAVTSERVETAPALEAALQKRWDAITCDWVMPSFTAAEALKVIGQHQLDVPVIIVSGQAAEEVAVTAMKKGAHDVISKNNLARLGPALERELREVEVRRARRRAEAALRASELRYRRLFETAQDGILILNAETGEIVDVNPFLLELLRYTREQVVGKQLWELGSFKDVAANHRAFRDLQAQEYLRYEHLPLESSDGRLTDVEFVSNAYQVDGEPVIQCNIRVITQRQRAERRIGRLNPEV